MSLFWIIRTLSSAAPRVPFQDADARTFQRDTSAAIASLNGNPGLFVGMVVKAASAPPGWLVCDGTVLEVTSFPALFQAIGGAFGGDGVKTFAIPTQEQCEAAPPAVTPPQVVSGGSVEPATTTPVEPGTPGAGGGNSVIGGVYRVEKFRFTLDDFTPPPL